MRVSLKWLREFVEINMTAEELADRLTMAGLEVEKVEHLGRDWSGVVIGEILTLEPHPRAERLLVAQVNIGQKQVQIVSGAPNLAVGQKVPVALAGAVLPGQRRIENATFKAIVSEGMLCSGAELHLSDDNSGIFILDSGASPGTDLATLFQDTILDLTLTPNRGDCLSMVGVAREVAALTGQKFRLPTTSLVETPEIKIDDLAYLDVDDPDLCPRYRARVILDVKIGPSPQWLQECLNSAGMRAINNVVDITNYCLLKWGQPLHAFDLERLTQEQITVRRAKKGETILTLDGELRKLDPGMLVIADSRRPVALAGIMGGTESEVTGQTRHILLESANFSPASIRHTSVKLGLHSESSLRFEKGLDPELVVAASDDAAQMMVDLAKGKVAAGYKEYYEEKETPHRIPLRLERIERLLGARFQVEAVAAILSDLGFKLTSKDGSWLVEVPSFRRDVGGEADLAEEVARVSGYGNIPSSLPKGELPQLEPHPILLWQAKAREFLKGAGLSEIVTYSMISREALDKLIPSGTYPVKPIKIANPMSLDHSHLRPTLLASLLGVLSLNARLQSDKLGFYELAKVYHPSSDRLPEERLHLAAVIAGRRQRKGWDSSAQTVDFFDLKGILETLGREFRLIKMTFSGISHPSFHPGRTAAVGAKKNGQIQPLGFVGELHPEVIENFDLGSYRVQAFELNFGQLVEAVGEVPRYATLPRFPGTTRDIALVLNRSVDAEKVSEAIRRAGGALLTEVMLFDVYTGEQMEPDEKSLAFSLTYQSLDRTLVDKEVDELHSHIAKTICKEFRAKLRD